jgi:hypothetical protein
LSRRIPLPSWHGKIRGGTGAPLPGPAIRLPCGLPDRPANRIRQRGPARPFNRSRPHHACQSSGHFPLAKSLGDSPSVLAILANDWSTSSLGPVDAWPSHLRLAASLLTRSPTPMALLWGKTGALIYNDGYARVLGNKHPHAMGRNLTEIWPEAADFNHGVMRSVQGGQSLSYRDISFLLTRDGAERRSWFDLDYSPVFDNDGQVAGTLAEVIEKTELVQT